MNFYIRFTDDIERDLASGKSRDFRDGSDLGGLCAWRIFADLSPWASDDEIIAAGKETARQISKNGYDGYSSSSSFAVVEGTYIGSANDGSLIKIDRVISTESL